MCVSINISNEWDIFDSSVCRPCQKGSFLTSHNVSVKEKDDWFWWVQTTIERTVSIKIEKNGAVKYVEIIFERKEFSIRRFAERELQTTTVSGIIKVTNKNILFEHEACFTITASKISTTPYHIDERYQQQ